MRLVSWNVAGLRACLKKGFINFFTRVNADIICVQEAKLTMEELEFLPEGYEIYLNPAEKKGYAGTLIYTRVKPLNVKYGFGIPKHDKEGRAITLEFDDFFLVTMYVPNSKSELERLDYRLSWEDDFFAYLNGLEQQKPVIFCGDLNVCHSEIDITNPSNHKKDPGFSDEERAKFDRILNSDYIDTYRSLNPNKKIYTWWSYLNNAREKNLGWRLDYFVISQKLQKKMIDAYIYNGILGSDHCPIGLDMNL